MTRTRVAWLALVLVALGLSLGYGLTRGKATPKAIDLKPLQARAALAACPAGVSAALPDVVLPCLGGGQPVPLRGTGSGRPTLVNVYGSWCGPCFDEMPVLAAVHRSLGDRLDLVGIDTEDEPRKALQFAIDVKQSWPALVDDDGVVSRAYGGGAPKMLFVDASGKVVHVVRKGYETEAALRADVARYLGVSS